MAEIIYDQASRCRNSIFYMLLETRTPIKTIVNNWIDSYKKEKTNAVLSLLQFFVDSSGCNDNISELSDDFTDTIRNLTVNFNESGSDYPLIRTGRRWKVFKNNLSDFLLHLIECCQNSVLYDDFMISKLLTFLTGLSDSQVRAFRHTSTFSVMKIMTGLVGVFKVMAERKKTSNRQHSNELRKSQDRKNPQRLNQLKKIIADLDDNLSNIQEMLLYLFKSVFVLRFRDSVSDIRAICIRELGTWLIELPDLFLDDSHLKYLAWSLNDKVSDVRKTSIQCLKKMFESENLYSKLELFVLKFKARIFHMALDVEPSVGVDAVDLISLMSKHYYSLFSSKDVEGIYQLVFCDNPGKAHAAGRFLNTKLSEAVNSQHIRCSSSNSIVTSDDFILKEIVRFFMECKLHDHTAYLVDSLLDCCASLRDWESMTSLLLSEPSSGVEALNSDEERILIDLMSCAVKQIASGTPPVGRGSNKKAKSLKELRDMTYEKGKLTDHFVHALPPLLNKFLSDRKCILNLLEIPMNLNLNLFLIPSQNKNVVSLLKMIQMIFQRYNDIEILEYCVKIFNLFCDDKYSLASVCRTQRDITVGNVVEKLQSSMTSWALEATSDNVGNDPDMVYSLIDSMKKIAILYPLTNLNDLGLWKVIFDDIEERVAEGTLNYPEEFIQHALSSCYFSVLWDFNDLGEALETGEISNKSLISQLKNKFDSLFNFSDYILKNASGSCADEAFKIHCELLLILGTMTPKKYSKLFGGVFLASANKIRDSLHDFLKNNIFQDSDTNLVAEIFHKRVLLSNYCKLISYKILPVYFLSDILVYYISTYSNFGDIFDVTIANARDIDKVDCARAMINTLITLFEDAKKTSKIEDFVSYVNDMKKFAKKCVVFLGHERKNEVFLKVMHSEGILFALKNIDKPLNDTLPDLIFFDILIELSSKLHKDNRAQLLKHLKDKCLPEVYAQSFDEWKYFVNYQKSLSTDLLRQVLATPTSIEKYVQKLDQDVRRTGRVTKKEIDSTLNEIQNSNNLSSTQALMLIRCCGSLLPDESPEDRSILLQKIWNKLEKMGVPLDISHYNALLRVYIENEHKFSPTEFLSELEGKGIEPNRVTFQRLISAYCQRGDIEGATRILEFMKEKQMPVNESVFSSLINGHFQADDVESALGILAVMKQANIKPTADTYTVLMCGYAKAGDMKAIDQTLDQADAEEVDIPDKDLLEVIYTLAINNHSDLVEQILGKLKKTPGFNQDAKNTILRLVLKGEDSAAVQILRSMLPATTPEGDPVAVGNFLIRQMVKSKRPLERIISLCEELQASGENEYAFSVATEASFTSGSLSPQLSLQLLSTLAKVQGVCQHYYWPVLVHYGKAKDLQGIGKTLSQIVSEVGQPLSGETLRDFVSPYLPPGDVGVLEMRKIGVPIATAAAAMVGHLLNKNQLHAAANLAMQFRANYTSNVIARQAVTAYFFTDDAKSFVTLVRAIIDNIKDESEKDPLEVADRMILDAVNGVRRDATKIEQLLQEFHNLGVRISPEAAEKIQDVFPGKDLTPEISTLLSKLSSPDLHVPELTKPEISRTARPMRQMNDEGSILSAIRTAEGKGDTPLGLKRQLLAFYCANKDTEKAEKLYKELEESGFEFSTGSLVLMMDLYIHHEKLPEALKLYDKIFKDIGKAEPVEIDPSKIIRLGALMVKMDKLDDAFKLFEKHSADTGYVDRGFNTNSIGWRFLNSLAEQKDPELLKKVFNKLVDCKLMEANNVTLGPLIKVHMLRDDIDSALAQFEECCQKYRATPWKNEIACKLIQKEDPISLQKLTDLSTDIHGEINSLYDLVLSFIECGRIRQARKILETPGLRQRNQRINSACERYNNEGKVNYLENLVEATKDLNHIDRSDIYYHLLLSYCKTDDVDKAFGLWTQMQDEDVQASDAFLVKLGELLERHNRPVPFAIPRLQAQVVPVPSAKATVSKNSPIKEFRKTMNSRSVDEALEALPKLNEKDLTSGDRSKLLNLLINNGRLGEASKLLLDWLQKGLKPNLRTISYIVNSLAKSGDVDTLNAIGNAFNRELKMLTSFSNRQAHGMVEAGRVDELLTHLQESVRTAQSPQELAAVKESFPRGGILSVLDSAPDAIPKVEEIAKMYLEKGLTDPCKALWAYFFSTGNLEKAEEYWKHVHQEDRIMYQPILKKIRANRDVSLGWDLLNKLKTSNITELQLGPVYSALIDIENISGNLSECKRILEEAVKDCTIVHITRGALLRLKRSLEASGEEFKYTLPPRTNRRRRRDDTSSSSSDSDSDSETAQKPRAQL